MFYLTLDILGTIAFALSGISEAARKRYDVLGCLVCGYLVAVGGGTLRDVLLGREVFWLGDPLYLVLTGLTLMVFVGARPSMDALFVRRATVIADTLGLAAFTLTGAHVAGDYEPWVAVIMGTLTGCAGSVIRDVLLAEEPRLLKTDFYASASIIGAAVFCALQPNWYAYPTAFVIIIVLRLLAIRRGWRLPQIR